MNYELAKQLKDAGFPQNPNGMGYSGFEPRGEICDLPEDEHNKKCNDWDCKNTYNPDVYPPLLSEIIEACGDNFEELIKGDMGSEARWYVIGNNFGKFQGNKNTSEIDVNGSTPEEAVAKLWLELNKK